MLQGRYRWLVFGFISLLMMINFFDRVVMSFAVVPIARTFHLNPTEMGVILSAFFWGLVPASIVAGYLSDRWGPKRVWSIGATWWSVFTAVTGLVGGYVGFILVRILFGFGEGPTLSNGMRVAKDWAAPRERGQAMGLAFSGVFLAPAIGAPIFTLIIAHFGWQAAFYVLGIAGLLWVVGWQYLFHDRPQDSPRVTRAELAIIQGDVTPAPRSPRPERVHWSDVNATVIATVWAGFCFGYALYFLLTWLPGYLAIERHLSLTTLGWLAGIPWLGAALGQYGGGTISDRLYRVTHNARIARGYVIALSLLVVGIALYLGIALASLAAAMVFLTLAASANAFAAPVIEATLVDEVPERAGTWGGVMQVAFTVPGIIAPILTGIFVTATHSFVDPFIIAAGILVTGGVVAAIWIRPRTQPAITGVRARASTK